jgi:hypothetical protein
VMSPKRVPSASIKSLSRKASICAFGFASPSSPA